MSAQQPSKFSVELGTNNEFFVGNLNKQKTRDEIFQDLTSIHIEPLEENLYISKFNMPKFNARKDQNGNLLLNLGYAFVTTKKPEMAQWLIKQKRYQLPDGSDIEIKPISKTKRLTANQNCKVKNYTKLNSGGEDGYKDKNGYKNGYENGNKKHGAIGDGRSEKNMRYNNSSENIFSNSSQNLSLFGNDSVGSSVSNSINNSVNNSVNNSANNFTNLSDNYNSSNFNNNLFENSNFGFNQNQFHQSNSGNSLFDNFAPASINYKSEHIWSPFSEPLNNQPLKNQQLNQQSFYQQSFKENTEPNNNSIFKLAKQASYTENTEKPVVLSSNDSKDNSPTNSDHQIVFRSI
jgi:hypothetical protein